MLTALALVATFVSTVYAGPTFDEHRARRRARRDYPAARVVLDRACSGCGRISCFADRHEPR